MPVKTNPIVSILMARDALSRKAALELLEDAREEVLDGADPEEVLLDSLGLEPDYLFDLIGDA
jgi:hypothetical protein